MFIPAPVFLEDGDPFDLGSGCELDGLSISCSELRMRMEAGTVTNESLVHKGDNDKWTPVRDPVQPHGAGIFTTYGYFVNHLGDVRPKMFAITFPQTTIPKNPEEQDLWKAGIDELRNRIEEREQCAELFGGKKKALKALDNLKPKFIDLPSPAIAVISGNTVKLDPTRFTSAGIPLKVAKFTGLLDGHHEVYSTRLLNLTGAKFAAFVVGHEFGHKMKSYHKKNDKDGFDDTKVALNNEQLRSACFNEY